MRTPTECPEYAIARKPDLDDPRVQLQARDYDAFRADLPLALRDGYYFGGYYRQFDGDIAYQAWLADTRSSFSRASSTASPRS